MNSKDRELMEQIFNEVECIDPFEQPMTDIETKLLHFALDLFESFQNEISQRYANGNWFFLAPPTNFSFQEN